MRASSLRTPRQTLPPPDSGGGGFITLDQIRPHPRVQNEYIDSPRPKPPGNLKTISSGGDRTVSVLTRENNANRTRGLRSLSPQIITVPPVNNVSPPLKKEQKQDEEDSIICKKCNKCRCGACTEPQDLPSKWCCNNECHISGQCVVETCSCYCCVQACFYHCGGKDEQDADYDCLSDPCACNQPNCVKRWTCMALMALCLPCLCCYWPMRGALKCCTACYNRCRKRGCQCTKTKPTKKLEKNGSQSARRLLLIESDSSSA